MSNRPDQLAPLIANATSEVRTQRPGTAEYVDADGRFVSGCPKCRGTGRWTGGFQYGVCFACKGTGKKKFSQPAEQRARNRVASANRRARTAEQNVIDFQAAYGEEYAWLKANADRWHVAAELLAKVAKYGELSEGQLGVARKGIARDASRAMQRADNIANAPAVDAEGVDRLKAAFDNAARVAAEKGRKFAPRLTMGGTTITPAKATSANAGGLYVKRDGVYMGKVLNGKFLAVPACDDATKDLILRFIKDPKGEATKYGLQYKFCCICNRTLRKEESMDRGMGPVCAEYFGWA